MMKVIWKTLRTGMKILLAALAEREGMSHECPLAQAKIDILRFIREYYKMHNSLPLLKAVCKNIHQPKNCTYDQIPDRIKTWKIAGLPKKLTTEVFACLIDTTLDPSSCL